MEVELIEEKRKVKKKALGREVVLMMYISCSSLLLLSHARHVFVLAQVGQLESLLIDMRSQKSTWDMTKSSLISGCTSTN